MNHGHMLLNMGNIPLCMEMTQTLTDRMDRIEVLLVEIKSKMDNFLGFEDLTEAEVKEVEELRERVRSGEYYSFNEVFED